MSTERSREERQQRIQELLRTGDVQGAEALLMEAVGDASATAADWNQLGNLLRLRGALGPALQTHGRAAELDPGDVFSRVQIGNLFQQMSFPDDAISWYRQALDLRPDDLILQLNHALVLPVVAESSEQMLRLRQRGIDRLRELASANRSFQLGRHRFLPHLFPLIYDGCDDRELLEIYGRLFSRAIAQPLPGARPNPRQDTRRRIGFLSGFFSRHTNSRAFEGWIRHLDRDRFRLVLIHLHDSRQDAVRARLDASADEVISLVGELGPAQRQLLNLQLDLLFFTDVGLHPMVTLLSSCRYAPVQVTGWGVPQTSGLASIDAYISGDLVEPHGAQRHYSETLIQVPGLPCCSLSDQLSYEPREREFFFLPSGVPLIGCLQTLWKLHPDFDSDLERIAQRVPEAQFVFVEADVSSYTQIFVERLQRSAPTAWQRMIMLQRLEREDFMALVERLDLLLDPPHFSSGIMMFDSLHTGTPIVAMEGPFLRSRFVAGAYRLIGLEDPPIARDREHYVEITARLLGDPEALQKLSSRVRERARAHLYDRLEGLRAFEDFALDAIDAAESARAGG
jgi:glycosyltransferase involved in cell wall biosynthesis